ncbi:MAG TPA: hypothetical protein VFF70_04575, partial [Anaerolineae bacterium]|nr:hypothetical protein [Anaerolineae bacterium]
MKTKWLLATLFIVFSMGVTACATLAAPPASTAASVQIVQGPPPTPDYSKVTPPPYDKHKTFDAALPPASSGTLKT